LAKPIKITIRGKDNLGIDAPTVEDLLSQIQDFICILHGVEEAIDERNSAEIVWRVTDASKNSPLTLEVTPFPKQHAMNIDNRASKVVSATASGISSISENSERPMYFSNNLIKKLENIFERVENGLAETEVDVSAYENAVPITVNATTVRRARELAQFRSPEAISYRELGSVEGFVSKIELDGYNRPIVWLKSRLDGQTIKCIAKRRGLDRIGHYKVAEILKGFRVQVFGLINYKDLEKISTVEVDDVHIFESDAELPDIDAIVAPGYTGGIEASEYLRQLREDE
jgi:hypothetical protein